ncbi:DapH/DapD/GlmU-related protein, partial [Mycobacterium sp. E740]|uniref:acyltransferase n=1 Tax=Mycobacterium sp. E740 TaxID=1834149 RepID=UPI000A8E7FE2
GAHSVINYGCFFDLGAATTLGAGVGIGYGVMIITCGHEIGGPEQRWSTPTTAPVVIDDGAWVGARSVILPGVTIGAGCVIAAGSVVTSDCEPNSFYAGVPARLKRRFPEGGTVDGAVRTQAGR